VGKLQKQPSKIYKKYYYFMMESKLEKIEKLIEKKQIDEAQQELSKLEPKFFKNAEYLYLRSKIFYLNKLYYLALDTLLIALEFEKKDKIYNLIAKIYNILGNNSLSNKILDLNLRIEAINSLKDELGGIYRKDQ
tara:strand:+ start:846 stop:1250 length:405 start_codon:yes stop_codon:yes gene_type:complete